MCVCRPSAWDFFDTSLLHCVCCAADPDMSSARPRAPMAIMSRAPTGRGLDHTAPAPSPALDPTFKGQNTANQQVAALQRISEGLKICRMPPAFPALQFQDFFTVAPLFAYFKPRSCDDDPAAPFTGAWFHTQPMPQGNQLSTRRRAPTHRFARSPRFEHGPHAHMHWCRPCWWQVVTVFYHVCMLRHRLLLLIC